MVIVLRNCSNSIFVRNILSRSTDGIIGVCDRTRCLSAFLHTTLRQLTPISLDRSLLILTGAYVSRAFDTQYFSFQEGKRKRTHRRSHREFRSQFVTRYQQYQNPGTQHASSHRLAQPKFCGIAELKPPGKMVRGVKRTVHLKILSLYVWTT